MKPERVLFIGIGSSAVAYYRCALPAIFLGADWIGVTGEPPELRYVTGMVQGGTKEPRFGDYDVIVVQQPRGEGWLNSIRSWQSRGIKVVYEIDDYVHAIRKMKDHDYSQAFDRPQLNRLEQTMRACDALICSTNFIGRMYERFNAHTFVCENGLDLARYQLTRPERETVNILWAGGTGHLKAAIPWLRDAVWPLMEERPETCCVTIGQPFAEALGQKVGQHRAVSIPFTLIDTYPAAMTLGDVAIGPALHTKFFAGKSDLRWLEAGAMGIPLVGDPFVYRKIEHGVTGFTASNAIEAKQHLEQLVGDRNLRLEIGENARRYVIQERSMKVACEQWRTALDEVLDQQQAA